jgi:hypothetical protein
MAGNDAITGNDGDLYTAVTDDSCKNGILDILLFEFLSSSRKTVLEGTGENSRLFHEGSLADEATH